MSDEMAIAEVLHNRGWTSTEERCIERRIRELMDDPDMDQILMYCDCSELGYLMWDGKSDEARDMLWQAGQKWARRIAEEEMK